MDVLNKSQWQILHDLLKENPIKGITLDEVYDPYYGQGFLLKEICGKYRFEHFRAVSGNRDTRIDKLGLIGVASLDLKDTRVTLTEGVSDFISYKITHLNQNVLGFTTLSGSKTAKYIVKNLFSSFKVIIDNDYGKKNNTGVLNANKILSTIGTHGNVEIVMPDGSFKDFTEQFIFDLKLNNGVVEGLYSS